MGRPAFFEGEFGADGLGAFDNPEAKDFSCVHDVVFVAVFLRSARGLLFWGSRLRCGQRGVEQKVFSFGAIG